MATVPISQPTVQNSQQGITPLSGAAATPAAFGAGVGQATAAVGDAAFKDVHEASQIATDFAIQASSTASRAGDVSRENATTALGFTSLPGGPEGNKGYYSLKGQAAYDALPAFQKAMTDASKDISDSLPDQRSKNMFQVQSGMRLAQENQRAAGFANTQFNVAADETSAARMSTYSSSLLTNYNDPTALANYQSVVRGEMADAGRRNGWSADTIAANTTAQLSKGYNDLIRTTAAAGNVPLAAQQFNQLRGQMSAPVVTALAEHLQPKVQGSVADSWVAGQVGGAGPASTGAPQGISEAIRAQEGPGTSSQGAVAGIMPDTFKQYAKPGESIANASDRQAVHGRIIDDLSQKAGGDPARIAVGYFSGPGNMSAPGAAQPYIEDKADKNGKLTSSYVADIRNRMGGSAAPVAPAGDASDANMSTYPDFAGMHQKAIDTFSGNHEMLQAVQSRLAQAQSQYELKTQASRDRLMKTSQDTTDALLAGNDTATIPEAEIRQDYRPAVADYMIGKMQEAKQAGQIFAGMRDATPDQIAQSRDDLAQGLGPMAALSRLRGKSVVAPPTNANGEVETPDMTGRYNTQLSPADETKFQAWGAANTKDGRNPANDTFDYDMRGFWKASEGNPTFADNGHAGDAFKKPNHPSFSDQSQYSGQDGYKGGHWNDVGDGKYTFDPSSTNVGMHGLEGPDGLKAYFAGPAENGVSTLNAPAAPPMDTAHFAQRQKDLAMFDAANARRQKMLADDPAAYAQQNPAVASAYKAVTDGPSLQSAIAASQSYQRSVGVADSDLRTIPNSQATSLTKSLMTTDPATGDMRAALSKMADQYGPSWPGAMKDLVTVGKLPPAFQALGSMTAPGQDAPAADLQRALQIQATKGDRFSSSVPSGQEGPMKQGIDSYLTDFRATTKYGGTEMMDGVVRPAVTALATYYTSQGQDGDTAAKNAVQGIVGAKYDLSGGTFRVPRGPGMPSASDVTDAGKALTNNFKPGDLAAGITPAQAQQGVWATNPDGQGVTLLATKQGAYNVVKTAAGKPVSMQFNALPKSPLTFTGGPSTGTAF
jgi:hypothetical protein